MLNCNECLKRDVCGKLLEVSRRIENLEVNYDFQELKNLRIKVEMTCENFLSSGINPKVLRGEE